MDETVYLFEVDARTKPALRGQSGETFTLDVRGSLADVKDVTTIPKPFTPECSGHPLTPIAGPIWIEGAEPGDAVEIELVKLAAHEDGKTAILREFGVLLDEFAEPKALACPVRNGQVWFAGRIPVPLQANLGTISTMPPEGYKPSYAGPYGGDIDQKEVCQGDKVHLPVMVEGAMVFFADPHAAIGDGIISGTGVECGATVAAKITLHKRRKVSRPIVENGQTVQILGMGESVEKATEDASRAAVAFVAERTGLSREEAYMLLGVCGELRIGTSPRPVMAARIVLSRSVLEAAGMRAVA